MPEQRLLWVTEVHNFGGFFGGDTVTLSAVPWPEGDEATLTIDEKALDNIQDRHNLAPEMLLQLDFSGERVDRARLVAARDRGVLSAALAPSTGKLSGPTMRAYRCQQCELWVVGQPADAEHGKLCRLCSKPAQ